MDRGMVLPRPAADILQGVPVGGAFPGVAGQPAGGVGDVLGVFVAPAARGDLAALVEIGAEGARAVVGHEDVELAVATRDPVGQLGVAGRLEGGALRLGKLDATDVSEMI